jgi:hypothetical protein
MELQFIEDNTIDCIMTYRSNKTLHPPHPPEIHTHTQNKRPNKQTDIQNKTKIIIKKKIEKNKEYGNEEMTQHSQKYFI